MNAFLLRWQHHILGALSGFDRLRFRGSLRLLSTVGGVMRWLASQNILLKDFVGHCERQTQQLRRHSEQLAQEAQRKVLYLPGFCNKEELVQKIRREQGVADNGLLAVLSTLEMCRSFDIHRNRQTQHIDLVARKRKALHYYFYFDDGKFGHTQVRLMSWFPFDTHIVLNGREWLAQDLDRAGIDYQRCDNCFRWIADFAAAQQLAHKQPKIHWAGQWERLRRRVHPLHAQFFPATEEFPPLSYYWTSEQTEWATDLAFRKPDELATLYATLIRRGMETLKSPDVLRFLGRKVPAHGGVNGHFQGEVVTDLKRRPEGVRLKHRVGRNTVKMYDKFGVVLRVETTLNDTAGLKVYRPQESHPERQKKWQSLRKSVADLSRRAALSQKSNERYLESLAAFDCETPLKKLTENICARVVVNGRAYRGLRPFEAGDAALLEAVVRGEFTVSGFRNRDLRVLLAGETTDAAQQRRAAARISRQLALLRAHGLIKRIPRTHRYELTAIGRTTITALLAARNATPRQLAG